MQGRTIALKITSGDMVELNIAGVEDETLKVWDLASGHALATLQGHANRVIGCAVV